MEEQEEEHPTTTTTPPTIYVDRECLCSITFCVPSHYLFTHRAENKTPSPFSLRQRKGKEPRFTSSLHRVFFLPPTILSANRRRQKVAFLRISSGWNQMRRGSVVEAARSLIPDKLISAQGQWRGRFGRRSCRCCRWLLGNKATQAHSSHYFGLHGSTVKRFTLCGWVYSKTCTVAYFSAAWAAFTT